jgi:(1->4)-alpha-D-glucan 1-alpha-D-glucosylmutase
MPEDAAGPAELRRRCERAGIATSFHDIWGNHREVPEASLRALLEQLGAGAAEPDEGAPHAAGAPGCFVARALEQGGRIWGPALQLYALRSPRNWGIGDFGDLLQAIEQWAARGAEMIGLNPLHALFPHDPARASPYSPSSRLALNVLYLDVEAVAEYQTCAPGRSLVRSEAFQRRLAALRDAELVDYPGVAGAKFEALELLYADFRQRHLAQRSPRAREFRAFQSAEAQWLRPHALFEALQHHFHAGDPNVWGWPAWPQPYRDPSSAAVARFGAERLERVEYHEYLQWLASRQLERAVARCESLGLSLGLYLDIAVSVDRGGSDAWANQEAYALEASIGAPPDDHNLKGQNWGLPPPRPRRAARLLERTLRRSMRYAGVVRIDHVMGLGRLYCVPPGASPREGAYLHYDFERLLGVLAAESRRQRCMVIGEDLGTVPEGMRPALERANVLSYRVLYFAREPGGGFTPPERYPRKALVAVSTHDLATLAGWWAGADLQWRERLSLFPDEARRRSQLEERAADRARLGQSLGTQDPGALAIAAHSYLARSPAMILAVQLEDALGLLEQANLPGTLDEHPNWRRRMPVTLDEIARDRRLDALGAALARERPNPAERSPARRGIAARIPRATYRLQLHEGFTFDDAAAIAPYLGALGVSHAYCSPILCARPGSTHGYDVVAHDRINPELGGREGFERMAAALRAQGVGIVLDVVPNHMSVAGTDNAWWLDVLENGPASAYAGHFAIDWAPITPELAGKVLLPVLGAHYGEALERGELTVAFDAARRKFVVRYLERHFPLNPRTYPADPADRAAVEAALERLNADRDALHELLEAQAYRLAFWRVAADEINYRRFFDINELAALRVESEPVFEATHGFTLDLLAAGLADGLRIDHPDGLHDPEQYFERLQRGYARRVGLDLPEPRPGERPQRPLYVVAEKITAGHERLRERWAIHGATGYRFGAVVNGVLVDAEARGRIDRGWRTFIGGGFGFEEAAYRGKIAVMRGPLASELTMLATRLLRIARADRRTRDYTFNGLRDALAEVAACLPVYRTYITGAPSPEDLHSLKWAVGKAARRGHAADVAIFDFVHRALAGRALEGASDELHAQALAFAMAFQQFTAPVTAKGVEDTALYNYNRLASLNEVGSDPEAFGLSIPAFHGASAERAESWPHTLLATSTHDNKRSEDVRCRINVLSEMPAMWRLALRRWRRLNRSRRSEVQGEPAPSPNDEYLLYQTLLGSFPIDAASGPLEEYRERIERYLVKAARESKARTSWVNPDAEYEAALGRFVREALDAARPNPFLEDLRAQARSIAWFGALNSLSMAILKLTSPGVPDLYQGNEMLDFSLVDPDNRRPVDYRRRGQALAGIQAAEAKGDLAAFARSLAAEPHDGRAKLLVTWRLLDARRRMPEVFRDGAYQPLRASGARAEHVLAYARRYGRRTVVVIAARLFARLSGEAGRLPLGEAHWGDTRVETSLADRLVLTNLLTSETLEVSGGSIALARAFASFPGAVLFSAS